MKIRVVHNEISNYVSSQNLGTILVFILFENVVDSKVGNITSPFFGFIFCILSYILVTHVRLIIFIILLPINTFLKQQHSIR